MSKLLFEGYFCYSEEISLNLNIFFFISFCFPPSANFPLSLCFQCTFYTSLSQSYIVFGRNFAFVGNFESHKQGDGKLLQLFDCFFLFVCPFFFIYQLQNKRGLKRRGKQNYNYSFPSIFKLFIKSLEQSFLQNRPFFDKKKHVSQTHSLFFLSVYLTLKKFPKR